MDAEVRSDHPSAYVVDPPTTSGYSLKRINILDTLGATCPDAPPLPVPGTTPPVTGEPAMTEPPAASSPVDAAALVQITEQGWSIDGADNVALGGIFENPNPSRWAATDIPYRATVLDANDGILSTSEGIIYLLLPGQETAIGGSVSGMAGAAAVEIRVGEPTWRDVGDLTGGFATTGVKTRSDDFTTTTTGRISQGLPQAVDDVEVVAIYRKDGAIIGGANGRTSFLDPTDAEPFQIDAYGGPTHIDATEVYGRFSRIPDWLP